MKSISISMVITERIELHKEDIKGYLMKIEATAKNYSNYGQTQYNIISSTFFRLLISSQARVNELKWVLEELKKGAEE